MQQEWLLYHIRSVACIGIYTLCAERRLVICGFPWSHASCSIYFPYTYKIVGIDLSCFIVIVGKIAWFAAALLLLKIHFYLRHNRIMCGWGSMVDGYTGYRCVLLMLICNPTSLVALLESKGETMQWTLYECYAVVLSSGEYKSNTAGVSLDAHSLQYAAQRNHGPLWLRK